MAGKRHLGDPSDGHRLGAQQGTLPLVFITEIGFAVAFGVLLDTFVVRSVLVTALNLDIGRWIWWPSPPHHQPDLHPDQIHAQATTLARR